MYALIMAGGAGTRLNLGEKPLITLCGRPLISYVIDAFGAAGCVPVIAASTRTPMTMNWCRAQGIGFCMTGGAGYVEDMVTAVGMLEEHNPLFVCTADIPAITPAIIHTIADAYRGCGKDACSTWVPASLRKSCRESMPYREVIGGIKACPAGVNILRGDRIAEAQDEFQLLLDEPRLALNVNSRADLADAGAFLQEHPVPYNKKVPYHLKNSS